MANNMSDSPSNNDLGLEDCSLCFCKIGAARDDGTIETRVTMPCCGNLLGQMCLDSHRRLTPSPSNTLCPLCRGPLQSVASNSMQQSNNQPTRFLSRIVNSNMPLTFRNHGAYPNIENHSGQSFAWENGARRQEMFEMLTQGERELAQLEDADWEGLLDVERLRSAHVLGPHGSVLSSSGDYRSFSQVANGSANLEGQSAAHASISHSALGPVDLYSPRSTFPQSQDGSVLVSMSLGVSTNLFGAIYDSLEDD